MGSLHGFPVCCCLLQVTQFDIYDDFEVFFSKQQNWKAIYRRSLSSQLVESHVVTLIGYHLDLTYGVSYWIAKNAWDTNWADNGLFRLEVNFPGLTASTRME